MRQWQGQWWEPARPEELQAGVLTEDSDGGLSLALIGGFDMSVRKSLPEGGYTVEPTSRTLPVLIGQCGATTVTLVDTWMRSSRGGLSLQPYEQTLTPRTALIGVGLTDPEDDAIFHTCDLRLENLLTWLDLGGMQVSTTADLSTSTGRLTTTTPVVARFDDYTVTAGTGNSGFRYQHTHNATSIVSEVWAHLWTEASTPRTYAGFDAISHVLEDLLTFAGDTPSGQLTRTLQYPLPPAAPSAIAGLMRDSSAEVLGRRVYAATPDDPAKTTFLFSCRDLPFTDLVTRWVPLRQQTADACNILFGTLYSRPTFTETRLLNVAIAAEALHRALLPEQRPMTAEHYASLQRNALAGLPEAADRAWLRARLRNEPSYQERLLALAELPDQSTVRSLIPDRAQWARQLKEARNGMAHTARPRVSYDELYELTEVSRYLLYLVLMQQLGLPAEVQQRALQQNAYLSHVRHEGT